MDFSRRQADPRRHLIGFTLVILFHLFIVYALVTGLAKKVVEVVRAPIETKVIEEVKKPPPPPEIVIPPPPRLEAPPPPFIPPPEVSVATPPPVAPTITAVPTPPPPEPVIIAPAPPPPPVVVEAAPPPPPPPAAPKPARIEAYCSSMPKPEIPAVDFVGKIALDARATISGNKITKVEIVPGSFTGSRDRKVVRAFSDAVTSAMMSYTCVGDNVVVVQPFGFNITN
jgi:periplasmic protein TonB